MEELTEQKCVACRVGAPSVTEDEIKQLHPKVPDSQIISEDSVSQARSACTVQKLQSAIAFTDAIGAAAEEKGAIRVSPPSGAKSPSPGERTNQEPA